MKRYHNKCHTNATALLMADYLPLIVDAGRAVCYDRQHRAAADYLRRELTRRERESLRLYYVEGWSMEAVAEQFGVTASTVSRNMKRGREKILRVVRLVEACA